MQPLRKLFGWLIEHEKSLILMTCLLIVALVLQVRFFGSNVGPDATVAHNQAGTNPLVQPSGSPSGLTGIWEMSVQKKHGGVQSWTLTLTQNGEALSGVITSEGGDLPVNGTIKGNEIGLSAKRFGATVEFPAKFDGRIMTGTMNALMIKREWTAKRK